MRHGRNPAVTLTTKMLLSCLILVKDLQNEREDCGPRSSFLQQPLRSFDDFDLGLSARAVQLRLDHTAPGRDSSVTVHQ
ncbi:hypothetical protein AE618_13780 [Bosea vaviloviae]|uniref:Uncharacterized protein n=1 Tax=Bosea vaviloviae TaxID=1526658 RepID=A0A0N1F4H1_9HYPH|nr:hypothetical protein AE618_13780 [Bosea vaviloviae]